jgi:hypothetical protein
MRMELRDPCKSPRWVLGLPFSVGSRKGQTKGHGRDRMVVGFTTNSAISAYDH